MSVVGNCLGQRCGTYIVLLLALLTSEVARIFEKKVIIERGFSVCFFLIENASSRAAADTTAINPGAAVTLVG